jgi:hypothetical protein
LLREKSRGQEASEYFPDSVEPPFARAREFDDFPAPASTGGYTGVESGESAFMGDRREHVWTKKKSRGPGPRQSALVYTVSYPENQKVTSV